MPTAVAPDARAYYDLLVRTSLDGKFPAISARLPSDPGSHTTVSCRYLTADGRKCAFGVLIPNAHYRKDLEGKSVIGLLNIDEYHDFVLGLLPDGVSTRDLVAIQHAHDEIAMAMAATWDHDHFLAKLHAVPCFTPFAPEKPADDRT